MYGEVSAGSYVYYRFLAEDPCKGFHLTIDTVYGAPVIFVNRGSVPDAYQYTWGKAGIDLKIDATICTDHDDFGLGTFFVSIQGKERIVRKFFKKFFYFFMMNLFWLIRK